MSAVGGSLSATGANVQAYAKHRERQTGIKLTFGQNVFFIVACITLNMAGILLFTAACAVGGAVATVMPIQTGANLLANMFWQMNLGMKHFNKSMRLGTLVLLCAVGELGELGPNEPADMDIKQLMSKPQAIAWVVFLVIGTLLAIVGSWSTKDRPVESFLKLGLFTTVVSLTTVLGSSISKTFASQYLTASEKIAALVIYFIDGCIMMFFTVMANAGCDVSIYIPLQLSSQLVINMGTGYLVWGDAEYIDKPVSYVLVYLLCILGVYLISPEVDVVGDVIRRCNIRRSRLSDGVAYSPLGKAFMKLMGMWERQCRSMTVSSALHSDQQNGAGTVVQAPPSDRELEGELEQTLRETFEYGLEIGAIQRKEIVALVLQYIKQTKYRPNDVLINWLMETEHFSQYLNHDPEFRERLKEVMTDDELRTIIALNATSLPSLSSSSLALPLAGNSFDQLSP
jgi:hypothetical protein